MAMNPQQLNNQPPPEAGLHFNNNIAGQVSNVDVPNCCKRARMMMTNNDNTIIPQQQFQIHPPLPPPPPPPSELAVPVGTSSSLIVTRRPLPLNEKLKRKSYLVSELIRQLEAISGCVEQRSAEKLKHGSMHLNKLIYEFNQAKTKLIQQYMHWKTCRAKVEEGKRQAEQVYSELNEISLTMSQNSQQASLLLNNLLMPDYSWIDNLLVGLGVTPQSIEYWNKLKRFLDNWNYGVDLLQQHQTKLITPAATATTAAQCVEIQRSQVNLNASNNASAADASYCNNDICGQSGINCTTSVSTLTTPVSTSVSPFPTIFAILQEGPGAQSTAAATVASSREQPLTSQQQFSFTTTNNNQSSMQQPSQRLLQQLPNSSAAVSLSHNSQFHASSNTQSTEQPNLSLCIANCNSQNQISTTNTDWQKLVTQTNLVEQLISEKEERLRKRYELEKRRISEEEVQEINNQSDVILIDPLSLVTTEINSNQKQRTPALPNSTARSLKRRLQCPSNVSNTKSPQISRSQFPTATGIIPQSKSTRTNSTESTDSSQGWEGEEKDPLALVTDPLLSSSATDARSTPYRNTANNLSMPNLDCCFNLEPETTEPISILEESNNETLTFSRSIDFLECSTVITPPISETCTSPDEIKDHLQSQENIVRRPSSCSSPPVLSIPEPELWYDGNSTCVITTDEISFNLQEESELKPTTITNPQVHTTFVQPEEPKSITTMGQEESTPSNNDNGETLSSTESITCHAGSNNESSNSSGSSATLTESESTSASFKSIKSKLELDSEIIEIKTASNETETTTQQKFATEETEIAAVTTVHAEAETETDEAMHDLTNIETLPPAEISADLPLSFSNYLDVQQQQTPPSELKTFQQFYFELSDDNLKIDTILSYEETMLQYQAYIFCDKNKAEWLKNEICNLTGNQNGICAVLASAQTETDTQTMLSEFNCGTTLKVLILNDEEINSTLKKVPFIINFDWVLNDEIFIKRISLASPKTTSTNSADDGNGEEEGLNVVVMNYIGNADELNLLKNIQQKFDITISLLENENESDDG